MRGGTIPHTRSTHARHISAEFSLSPLCNLSLRNAQCRTDPTSRNQAQTSEREHHSDGLSCAAVCELASSGLEVEHTVGHQHTPVTMYSVEDLLISHGYKVPQRNSNNVPVSHSSSPHPATYEKCPPPRSDSRCEIGEKRKGHSGVNGYEGDSVYSRHAAARGFPSDAENRVRKQRTQDVDNGNLGDGRVPEDSLTTDSGFFDSHRGIHSQPRSDQDVSYWRRRGQDFSVLLDYADFRDPRRSGGGVPNKPEGMQRRPESALSTEEHNRERQRRAESARAREREMALHQWRIAAERKYQSLGTEEWRPMTSMSHQASEKDLAQEQRRPRTAEGAVPPKPKSKSQSLPRMALQSESLQYFSIPNHRHDSYGSYRVNGHYKRDPNGRHLSDGENRERWTDRSGAQSAPPSKPRFSRPLRPPSYEVHQQMRGSAEMLSGELPPRARDRTPLPFSRQEYFVQELGGSEPPGYIPPPSYRRQPMVKGGHRTYPISMGAHQFRGDPYMQGSAMTEVKEWFFRQTGMAWPEQYRDGRRSVPCRRQAYPGYGEEWMGNVQYISFDDPRVRHISGAGVDGNSLTDADKIRNIRNEIPVKLEKSNDSAFPLTEKPLDCTEPSKSNISDCVNEDSIHKDVKELVSCNSTSDQHCNRHPVDRSNTIAIQMTVQQNSNQGFIETVTQVKKFEAKTVAENKSSSKKKFKETMFCLVSVPISMQANRVISDPNNNEKMANSIEHTVVEYKSQVGRETHIQSSSHLSVKSSNVSALTKENDTASKHFGQADKVPSEHWHGDHYKNQETQTGSPEVSRNTLTQSTDGVGPDCSTICEYPISGQKDLNPSSNSAFSRTGSGSSSSIKSPTLPQSALAPSSPDHQPLLRKMGEKQQSADSQEVFGQFLLKPVNRRKWDAIGELESFNKEIQDKMKCPNVGKKIEQLDEALRNVLELSNTSRDATDAKQDTAILSMPQETQHLSQKGQVTEKYGRQNNLNVTPNSGSIGHENTKRTKSSFTKVNVNLNTQTLETPAAKANYYANFEVMQTGHFDPGTHRQDIPVPKECLLKDVGLTVYTAIPDTVTSGSPTCLSPESPMLTSPSDNSEMYETLQITSSDSSGDLSRHSPELAEGNQSLNNNNTFKSKAPKEKDPGSRSAEVTRSGKSSRIHVIKSLHCRFQANYEDGDDHLYSDYLSWSNEKTLADEHLETLLSQEKANSMNTEDLSNLYKVQCAKGIPENESIEQRAARILGISVPVEALVVDQVEDKQLEVNSTPTTDPAIALQTKEICLNEEKSIDGEFKKVTDGSVEECRRSYKDVVELGLGENQEPKEDLTSSEKHIHRTSSVLELPEFPPSNLCLSLPLTEDKQLTLSVCRADLMETAVADVPDNQQNNLSPYLSPSSPNNFTSLDCCIYAKEEYSQLVESMMAKETEPKQCSEEGDQSESHGKTSKEEFEYFEKGSEPNTDVVEDGGHMENEELVKGEGGTTDELIQENHQTPPKSLSRPIPHPRSGKVAKREITLSEGSLCQNPMYSGEDEDKPFLSDAYDPSRVERV